MMAENEEDRGQAMSVLLRVRALKKCPHHEDEIMDGPLDIQAAYPMANKMINDGDITLRKGMSRRDLTDLMKSVYEDNSMIDECYYCNKD